MISTLRLALSGQQRSIDFAKNEFIIYRRFMFYYSLQDQGPTLPFERVTEKYIEIFHVIYRMTYAIPIAGDQFYIVACMNHAFEKDVKAPYDFDSHIKDLEEAEWPITASLFRNARDNRIEEPFIARFKDLDTGERKWFAGFVRACPGTPPESLSRMRSYSLELLVLLEQRFKLEVSKKNLKAKYRNRKFFKTIFTKKVESIFDELGKNILASIKG